MALVSTFAPLPAQIAGLGACISILAGWFIAYIEQEDTPRSLVDQLDWLRRVGFRQVEVLHKNSVFAAFGAVK